jgi:hypothetical protein
VMTIYVRFYNDDGELWSQVMTMVPRVGETVVLPSGREVKVTRVAHDLTPGYDPSKPSHALTHHVAILHVEEA